MNFVTTANWVIYKPNINYCVFNIGISPNLVLNFKMLTQLQPQEDLDSSTAYILIVYGVFISTMNNHPTYILFMHTMVLEFP